ncbi:MAG: beta strand repeat-containing protein [Isosphaeraceae bacterium]
MFGFYSAAKLEREIDHRRPSGRPRGQGSTRRRGRHPHLESLETRITPSTMTWTGTDSGAWMTAGNWASDTVPQAGDDLVFPANSSNDNVLNNFPANTQFNSITIQAPGYSLTGNPVDVVSGLNANFSSGASNDALNTDLEDGIVGVNAGGTLNLEGSISGTVGISLSGGGTLDLSGTNTYTGTTVAGFSTLLVDSTIGAVQDSQGVLGGNGTVGNVTSVGGTISPGHAGSPNVLNTGSLSLDNNSTFVTEIDGTSPGNGSTGYGQVVASGPVSLGGATLDATLASGYIPTVGAQYTIISNTGGSTSGTFAGLTPGSTDVISGYDFQVSYQGGSGGNVVLTALPFPTTTAISASTQTSTYGQSVTFTAVVSGSQDNAPGQVAFYDGNPTAGGTQLGVANVGPGEQATFSTSTLDVAGSPHEVYAEYLPSTSSEYGTSTTTQPAAVTINPATLTVSLIGSVTKTYDGNTIAVPSSGNYQISGLVGDDVVTIDQGLSSYDTKDVGTGKTVTVAGLSITGADASNYVLGNNTVSGPVGVIVPADISVSGITAQDKVYDGTTTATIDATAATISSGVVSGDDVSLVTSGAVGSFASKNVGLGERVSVSGLTLSGADAGNYIISPPAAATASITPAPLTVTADPATMTYGGTLPALTDTVSGLVGADTVSTALTGSLATTATSSSGVGSYPIAQGTLAAVDGNYTITFNGASLSITPAPLTIAANDASKVYGAPIPTLTASYSGFVNGDTAASLEVLPSLSTSATSSSPVGVYPINISGAVDGNYTITYVPGTLGVDKAGTSATVTGAIRTSVFGQTTTFTAQVAPVSPGAGQPTGTVTFLVNGTPIGTAALNPTTGQASFSTSTLGLGSHTITATYSGDSDFNPSSSSTSQSGSIQEAVTPAATESILTAQAVRNQRGKLVKVDLVTQVLVVAPGSGTPTGSVTYFRRGRPFLTVSASDGQAVASVKPGLVLKKSISVVYQGNSDFDLSASGAVVPTKKSLRASARPLSERVRRK